MRKMPWPNIKYQKRDSSYKKELNRNSGMEKVQ